LVRHLTLLTPTQNLIKILPGIDRTMKVLIAGCGLGKATVVVSDEAGQERVCRLDRADAGKPQFLHQVILQTINAPWHETPPLPPNQVDDPAGVS